MISKKFTQAIHMWDCMCAGKNNESYQLKGLSMTAWLKDSVSAAKMFNNYVSGLKSLLYFFPFLKYTRTRLIKNAWSIFLVLWFWFYS